MLLPEWIFYLSFISAFVLGKDCHKVGTLIYEDLGCTPQYADGDDACPIKYSCEALEQLSKKCYFQGKSYKKGENVDFNSSPSCNTVCTCEGKEFVCSSVGCPDGVLPNEECYMNYTINNCCPHGGVCPGFNDTEKCIFGGKEYREGEEFYPPATCYRCVCQKGFKGKLEAPFCGKIRCGQELSFGPKIGAMCAPLYRRSSQNGAFCCPDDWVCADEFVMSSGGKAKSEEMCKFGDKKVYVGQHFEILNLSDFDAIKCICIVPPLMTCIEV